MSAASKLTRALTATAKAAGCAVQIVPVGEQPWASATFVGGLYALTVERAVGEPVSTAFDDWLDTLADTEFAVSGHVVAELTIERNEGCARLVALMLGMA